MIDKKPFRVDNETVKNWATTTYDVPEGASIQDICFSAAFIAANEMAADLLDARELIDKQEALIKEMHNQLSQIRSDFDASDIECNDAYICVTNVNEIIAILEKTKEYV